MNTVYICTRGRINNLKKVVPRWLDQNFRVVLVVEKREYQEHLMVTGDYNNVYVTGLPSKDRGIGYARSRAVDHASNSRLRSIIMADDDIRPAVDSSMSLLLREAEKPGTLGVGAVLRIHDHFTGGAVTANSGVILCPGGWGHRLYGLNVNKTMELGNYDTKLDCLGEDDELQRQGIAAGIPWLVHCDVWAESIGARNQPGGIESLTRTVTGTTRPTRELQNHMYLFKRWPEYVSCPPKKFRMAWQRMLTDYIPDWRERSAIHGGHWNL